MYLDSPTNRIFLVEKTRVMEVACPFCLVPTGTPCIGVLRKNGSRRQRTTLHKDRYFAYDASQERS